MHGSSTTCLQSGSKDTFTSRTMKNQHFKITEGHVNMHKLSCTQFWCNTTDLKQWLDQTWAITFPSPLPMQISTFSPCKKEQHLSSTGILCLFSNLISFPGQVNWEKRLYCHKSVVWGTEANTPPMTLEIRVFLLVRTQHFPSPSLSWERTHTSSVQFIGLQLIKQMWGHPDVAGLQLSPIPGHWPCLLGLARNCSSAKHLGG